MPEFYQPSDKPLVEFTFGGSGILTSGGLGIVGAGFWALTFWSTTPTKLATGGGRFSVSVFLKSGAYYETGGFGIGLGKF